MSQSPETTPTPPRKSSAWVFIVLILLAASYFYSQGGVSGKDPSSSFDVTALKFMRGEFGELYAAGIVHNTSRKTYSYVQVEVNLYSKDGTMVGSTLANCNNLGPNEKWEFKAVVIDESKVESFKVKGITAF